MTKSVYTIPSHLSFLDALAEGLWHAAGSDPFKLSKALVLLPTRRACRHLREAFLRQKEIKAALLPRMQPLGDIDEEEFYFISDQDLDFEIPPAITPLRRQLLLTQLIRAKEKDMPLDQAAQLAEALGLFLDQVQIERCDLKKIAELVEEKDLAEHWRQTVQFLEILTDAWPQLLAEEGCLDPIARRNLVLEAQIEAWRKNPPPYPVIAAGSTGTVPVTADFLKLITSLPMGAVVLPGLDRSLDEEAWQAISETHPQFNMKVLLKKFEIGREDVKFWNNVENVKTPRTILLQETMRPAEVSEEWRHLDKVKLPPEALDQLNRVECDHSQEEAQVIALIMRSALETKAKDIALITADRLLAERVKSVLERWKIAADDSAGIPLSMTPIGAFLLNILSASLPEANAVEYLSLLKHPYAAFGLSPVECRAKARELEINVWRSDRPEISEWLKEIREKLAPMTKTWRKPLPLYDRIHEHILLSEQMATSDKEKGAARLWFNEAGETTAAWLDQWQTSAHGFPLLTGEEYRGLFKTLLGRTMVRPNYGQHPRLSILGPLEARLIQADLIILGGLNEGSWPPEMTVDPWMSRPMKTSFGLPVPERRVGLSAHDFVQLASAPHVVLTRSKRSGNAPTVPSRFLLQLETVLKAAGYSSDGHDALAPKEPWLAWAHQLDEPAEPPRACDPPEPRPPQRNRPTELSVTEIATWRRNPYAIYAKHILKLRMLNQLDADIDAADRGMLIHEALDQFIKQYPSSLPANALEELRSIGKKVFSVYDELPEVKTFWWPRFERIAGWFVAHEHERRAANIKVLKAEAKGSALFDRFTLKGRVDRIDLLSDGTLAIVDYKTGAVPSVKEVEAGYEPQLPLLALIAEKDGFIDLKSKKASELSYWKLSGGREVAREQNLTAEIGPLMEKAEAGLINLIKAFSDPKTPYQAVPKPRYMPRYDDYAHLARLAEWGRSGEED